MGDSLSHLDDLLIRVVRAWMFVDKLKLNEEKTEFMLITTHQQLSKVRTDSLLVAAPELLYRL